MATDAIVIGGGFYGAAVAIYLAKARKLARVTLLERATALMTRASYHNQARVHNGYHYPRSLTTAYRSRINLPKFMADWPGSIRRDFTTLYAVARRNSKVTARQFERFCRDIGAKIEPAGPALQALFAPRLIERAFLIEEYAFDAAALAEAAGAELRACGVQIRYGARVTAVHRRAERGLDVVHERAAGRPEVLHANYVFNCTYSGINQLGGDFPSGWAQLKHEIAEMALVRAPPALGQLGVTVMDGPFFSLMPFPARGLHSLSHVRYTPHVDWEDSAGIDPYQKLALYPCETRFDRMVRDVGRYLPAIYQAHHVDSLFEVKTVLKKNEDDDGRPIAFKQHHALPGCFSILGAKIDNIYDVLERLDDELH